MIHSFIFDFDQLERVQDLSGLGRLRILKIVLDSDHLEDRYICLIDCNDHQALLLNLL